MAKCKVLIGFAGINYASAAGKEIDLPLNEARSLASQGIVEIMEDYAPAMAYETPEAAAKGKQTRIIKPKK